MDSSSKPKVSVIVPIYNVEKYLRKCVDSILAQTLTDIEVILVDDGSPDGCPQIVDEYAAKDPRVVPVHQRNGGLSAARNGGLSVASGKYVGFVDADDWVEPRMYEELFSACEASTADIGACGIRCEFLSGGADVDQAYYDLKFSGKFKAVPAMLEKIDVSVCNKIFRREILSRAPELRFPDGLNFEDCEFFWRYFLRAETIFCLPKNLYHYVRHGSGIMRETMNGINPHSVDAVKVCMNILKDLLKRNCFSAYAFPFFLLLAGHYGMSSRSRHPDTDSETRKILRAAKYKKYRSSLPERENWAWEILDNVSEGKKTPLRYKIWHTKNCKGVSRSFFCGIRVRKKKIPESDIAFACPEAEKNAGGDVPKVSVVVPVYNVEKYLRQSLDALVAQTLREIEIICVNDGSTDASLSILEEYSRKDVRIRIISRQNAGYGSAVNAGIGAARGEFLAIAEPDDYVDPAMFETLYFAAKKYGVPLVKCDWELFWETEGTETKRERWRLVSCGEDQVAVFDPRDNPTMIADASGIWAGICSLAWLRANDIRCLETPGASFQDTSFVLKTYLCAEKMAFVPKPFVSYRQTNPSSSINAGASKAFAVFREFDEIIRYCEKHGIFDEKSKALVLKKMRATGVWNFERFTGDVREKTKKRLKEYFRRFLKYFSERPPEVSVFEWESILEIAGRQDSRKNRIKAFLFEESFSKDSVRIKLFRCRVLKTPLVHRGEDSLPRRLFVRLLAGLFFSDGAKRKAFRARHLNLNPRDGVDVRRLSAAEFARLRRDARDKRVFRRMFDAIVPATRGKVAHTERHLRRAAEEQTRILLGELRRSREEANRRLAEMNCALEALRREVKQARAEKDGDGR